MISGAHLLLYSTNAKADREFLRDVLEFHSVDAGEGWLIFRLPPAEAGVHPGEERHLIRHGGRPLLGAVLYLMCDDLKSAMASLQKKGVQLSEIQEESWGIETTLRLPSGGELGLYQPRHKTAIDTFH